MPSPLLLLTPRLLLLLLLPLLLQDKKRRQYVITALHDTKVDLKGARSSSRGGRQQRVKQALAAEAPGLLQPVLSVRLGCGKGGLSWGSEELLAQSLQVREAAGGCMQPGRCGSSMLPNHTCCRVLLPPAACACPCRWSLAV